MPSGNRHSNFLNSNYKQVIYNLILPQCFTGLKQVQKEKQCQLDKNYVLSIIIFLLKATGHIPIKDWDTDIDIFSSKK